MATAWNYCGWGAKQGSKVRSWKNRYFILRGRELVYYSGAKSDGSGAGLGEKGRLRVVNVGYSPDRKNGLLIHGEGKSLKMTTASVQESRLLFRKIKEAIGEQEKSLKLSPQKTPKKRSIEREGWLVVQEPQFQTWKRRYVTLCGRTMEFGAEPNSAPVERQTLVKVEADETSPLSLRLGLGGEEVIHVTAESRVEIEDWDRAFAAVLRLPLALKEVGNQKMETLDDTELVTRKYSTAVCEGWVEKLGRRRKDWKKRYMSLANGMLEYRKEPMEHLSAELNVTDVRYSKEYSGALEIEFGSSKLSSNSNIICVCTESAHDLNKWMRALCDAAGKPPLHLAEEISEALSPSSTENRQSKPQPLPFPRNGSLCQDDDMSSAPSSDTQPLTPSDADRFSDAQLSTDSSRIKRGWLYKQDSEVSPWMLRYFVLSGSTLHHYKNDNGTSETLGNVTSVSRSNESLGSLGVHFDDGSTLNIYGETKADTEAWYAALCKTSWSSGDKKTERNSVFDQEEEELQDGNDFNGWLLKKGQNFKTWKRRYFVLKRSRLAYSAAAGSDVLGSGVVFEVDVGDLRPFCLKVRFQNGRLLHVVAPTQEAFSKWFDVLRKASNLVESFLLQGNGELIIGEEFDNDVEDVKDVGVEFTDEDISEYEVSLRDGGGASLWIAAMQNKPEYDALSSSSELCTEDVGEADTVSQASEEITPNESQGCVGWLKKEGRNIKSWKLRYFTLYGSKLSYYKSEKGSLLRSVNVVDVAVHPLISQGLTVSTVGGRKLNVQADTKEEFEKWLTSIRGAVSGENNRMSAVVTAPTINTIMNNGPPGELRGSVSHSGWLQKEGRRFKTWKRRFFTLKNSALIYYSEIGGVARGHGMVRGAYEDETKANTLLIKFRSDKTLRVTAASEAEMKSWFQVFSQAHSLIRQTTNISDTSDDVVDSEGEGDGGMSAARISRFNSSDYVDDPISNDTLMRLREEEGKATFLESRIDAVSTSHPFKGELTFDNEEEEKDDLSLTMNGAAYYRQLLVEDKEVQEQRLAAKLADGEPLITGCAPCCVVM